jgi:hypothetical protein
MVRASEQMMTLSVADRAELDRLGIENVKLKLGHAGPGSGSVVPGLGAGFGMTRGDVEDWLGGPRGTKQRVDTLWWAKAATWIGAVGILVAIAIAALGR